jgi:hypothetical protein
MTQEHRLRVFENRALIQIFGHQEKELTGNLNKLHNKDFMTVFLTECYSGDQITENKRGWARDTYGEKRDTYSCLVGNLKESICKTKE